MKTQITSQEITRLGDESRTAMNAILIASLKMDLIYLQMAKVKYYAKINEMQQRINFMENANNLLIEHKN